MPNSLPITATGSSHDASVVAILTRLTDDAAIALGSLRRRGFAVSVILNMYDGWDFGEAAGALAAQGIAAYHLPSETAIAEVCRSHLALGLTAR